MRDPPCLGGAAVAQWAFVEAETRGARIAYGGLLTAALVLTALVLTSIWQPLLLAAVLAGGLWRLHERLADRFGGRRTWSALLLTVATFLFVVGPLTLLVLYLISEAVQLVQEVREIVRRSGPGGLIVALPDRLESIVRAALAYASTNAQELSERLREGGTRAILSLGGIVGAVGGAFFQIVLMIIAQFFFLREGHRVARWLRWAYPLPPYETDQLLRDFRYVARNVVGATLLTAFIQASLATVGYAIAGVPTPVLFGAITLFAAFIPAVGTPVVGVPLAVFLFFTGDRWQGIFLLVWALGLVATVDNILRPLFMTSGGGRVQGTVLFFAIIGGITALGPIGIVVGPLAVVFLDSVIRLRRPPVPRTPVPEATTGD